MLRRQKFSSFEAHSLLQLISFRFRVAFAPKYISADKIIFNTYSKMIFCSFCAIPIYFLFYHSRRCVVSLRRRYMRRIILLKANIILQHHEIWLIAFFFSCASERESKRSRARSTFPFLFFRSLNKFSVSTLTSIAYADNDRPASKFIVCILYTHYTRRTIKDIWMQSAPAINKIGTIIQPNIWFDPRTCESIRTLHTHTPLYTHVTRYFFYSDAIHTAHIYV